MITSSNVTKKKGNCWLNLKKMLQKTGLKQKKFGYSEQKFWKLSHFLKIIFLTFCMQDMSILQLKLNKGETSRRDYHLYAHFLLKRLLI